MKSGCHPSKEVKSGWSLSQLDYFYKNCSKFNLEPYNDDEDVASENEGMADVMRPENEGNHVPVSVNDGIQISNVINES